MAPPSTDYFLQLPLNNKIKGLLYAILFDDKPKDNSLETNGIYLVSNLELDPIAEPLIHDTNQVFYSAAEGQLFVMDTQE